MEELFNLKSAPNIKISLSLKSKSTGSYKKKCNIAGNSSTFLVNNSVLIYPNNFKFGTETHCMILRVIFCKNHPDSPYL